ncbi:MAG: hypothetical protein KC476_05715 [Cyanobacteria bacterium HKST-UBA06]|nr:hypothetical protein [Cyanobacteria bacterium HKST-UBA06]
MRPIFWNAWLQPGLEPGLGQHRESVPRDNAVEGGSSDVLGEAMSGEGHQYTPPSKYSETMSQFLRPRILKQDPTRLFEPLVDNCIRYDRVTLMEGWQALPKRFENSVDSTLAMLMRFKQLGEIDSFILEKALMAYAQQRLPEADAQKLSHYFQTRRRRKADERFNHHYDTVNSAINTAEALPAFLRSVVPSWLRPIGLAQGDRLESDMLNWLRVQRQQINDERTYRELGYRMLRESNPLFNTMPDLSGLPEPIRAIVAHIEATDEKWPFTSQLTDLPETLQPFVKRIIQNYLIDRSEVEQHQAEQAWRAADTVNEGGVEAVVMPTQHPALQSKPPSNVMLASIASQQDVGFLGVYEQRFFEALKKSPSIKLAFETMNQQAIICRADFSNFVGRSESSPKGVQIPQLSEQTNEAFTQGQKRKRRVLLVVGHDQIEGLQNRLYPIAGRLKEILLEKYRADGLKPEDIELLVLPDEKAIAEAVDQMATDLDEESEYMIALFAHGSDMGPEAGVDPVKEGHLQGSGTLSIQTMPGYSVREPFLEAQMHKLQHVRAGVVFGFNCHSGALLAQNNPGTDEGPTLLASY